MSPHATEDVEVPTRKFALPIAALVVVAAIAVVAFVPRGGTETAPTPSGSAASSAQAAAVSAPAAPAAPAANAPQSSVAASSAAGSSSADGGTTAPVSLGSGSVEKDVFVIDASGFTDQVTFVPYEENGVNVRLMVVKGSKKLQVRLDTCESCNGSPQAYYLPDGEGDIVCQNCGFDFSLGNLSARGRCNPMHIDYELDGSTVKIETAELDAAAPLFDGITYPA